MLKLVFLGLLYFPAVAKEPERTVTYLRDFGPQPVPTFDKGYLIFTNKPNGVEVWGPDGKLAFRTILTSRPELSIMNTAIDSDGTVAVSFAFSVAPRGYAGGISVLDGTGREIRFMETDRYMPSSICFDSKHALWAFGWQRDAIRNENDDSEEYLLFRKFSPDGKQIGAYAPRSLFRKNPGLAPGTGQGGAWRLRASGDRVGAITNSSGTNGPKGFVEDDHEWIELSLDGTLIGHWKLGNDTGMGTAFISSLGFCRQNIWGQRVEYLDRGTGAWKTLGVSAADAGGGALGNLLGADGDYLVFGRLESGLLLSWVLALRD
jgi:hypothetical protein